MILIMNVIVLHLLKIRHIVYSCLSWFAFLRRSGSLDGEGYALGLSICLSVCNAFWGIFRWINAQLVQMFMYLISYGGFHPPKVKGKQQLWLWSKSHYHGWQVTLNTNSKGMSLCMFMWWHESSLERTNMGKQPPWLCCSPHGALECSEQLIWVTVDLLKWVPYFCRICTTKMH